MNRKYLLTFSLVLLMLSIKAQQITPNATSLPAGEIKSMNALPLKEQKKTTQVKEQFQGFNNNTCATHELTKKYYESIGKWSEFNQTYLEEAAKTKPYKSQKTPGVNTIAVIYDL